MQLKFLLWCRRGDSNPHELPHTALNRARLPVPPLRPELSDNDSNPSSLFARLTNTATAYFCVPLGEAAGEAAGEPAGGVAGASLAAGEACGTGVGTASGAVDCKTEWLPVTPGSESIRATSIKAAAAPIVILERMLAVPLGPNAVLETLAEKRSPAPDLPGCNKMTTTSTMQDKINSP